MTCPPIPMAIQEPSVIAACSSAAKWVSGFQVETVVNNRHLFHSSDNLHYDGDRLRKLVDGEVLVLFQDYQKASIALKKVLVTR